MVSPEYVLGISALAGFATGIGALPILFTDHISHRVYDAAVGLAAGVMLSASVFNLIQPGLDLGTVPEVAAGIGIGALFLLGVNAVLPHLNLHFIGNDDGDEPFEETDLHSALMVGGAITIHNVPEGLAIGIAFASGEQAIGLLLAVAIAFQNIPDGFAMAVPAASAGVSKVKTIVYTALSGGIPEPVAALLGFALVSVIKGLFPLAAGFAAGAMIAVIFREMIPSSHGHGYADTATATFVAGFILMMLLETLTL